MAVDVQHAVDRLRHDDSAVQQVGPSHAGQRAGQEHRHVGDVARVDQTPE